MQILNREENREQRIAKVREGIRFILSHFEGRQPLFPRKMSTASSQGRQFTVYNEQQILNECIKSNFIDCRLNAYPVLTDDDIAAGIQAPNIIFIDIDLLQNIQHDNREHLLLLSELNKTLTTALNTIRKRLNGFSPTVIWTGNGYHIYIILDTRPLELIAELSELSKRPSEQFLRFAEINFSNGKSDSKHSPSFKSYLLRIPFTLNSKCFENCKDPDVRIIQKFDPFKAIANIDSSLLHEFRLYLADQDIRNKVEAAKKEKLRIRNIKRHFDYNRIPKCYRWIETNLLQTPISDHRKYTINLVLAPFLVNIKHLPYDKIYSVIHDWTIGCNSLKRLEPSVIYFQNKIKAAINNAIQNGIVPIKRENIQKNYPDWYNDFRKWLIIFD